MTTLSLEASKKVFEIVGEYETEKSHCVAFLNSFQPSEPMDVRHWEEQDMKEWKEIIPAPTFAELIRVLPKFGEKKCWNPAFGRSGTCLIDVLYNMSVIYMNAPTEQEGMKAIETYLMKLL